MQIAQALLRGTTEQLLFRVRTAIPALRLPFAAELSPAPGLPGLLGYRPQQGYRHVGFNAVLTHVAGGAAMVFQEEDDFIQVAGQVDCHRYRFALVDWGALRRLLGPGSFAGAGCVLPN